MLTLGVDLAAQAPRTGLCGVRWKGGTATVELASAGAGDEAILAAAGEAVNSGGAVAQAACLASDDVLDALLCAFVACAAALRRTWTPDDEHADAAEREGWIHMPSGELADLFTGPQSHSGARA